MKKFSRIITNIGLLLILALLYGCCCTPDGDPPLACGEGTTEQGTGVERECVPTGDPPLECGEGTTEQGTGVERECVPDAT